MKTITLQKTANTFTPHSLADIDLAAEYKDNQLVIAEIHGTLKTRSLEQLALFWVCCEKVVENAEQFANRQQVAEFVKVQLRFVDHTATITFANGDLHFKYRSIGFASLKHMEACNFFDNAFPILAELIGVTVESLLENAEG